MSFLIETGKRNQWIITGIMIWALAAITWFFLFLRALPETELDRARYDIVSMDAWTSLGFFNKAPPDCFSLILNGTPLEQRARGFMWLPKQPSQTLRKACGGSK